MRPTLSLLLLSALCLAPSALAIPQQNGQPGQSNGQISVTVSANGQTRQVKLPLVPGLRGAPECDNDDGLDPTDNDPEDVFCRNLRAELGKIPELASLARGGAITITAFASSETSTGGGNGGNGGQNGGGGGGGGSTPAPAFKENAQNVVVYRPPNNAAPVTITVPAVPGLRSLPRCDNDDGTKATDNDPDDNFCRQVRKEIAAKVPSQAGIVNGGAFTVEMAASGGAGGNGGAGGSGSGGNGGAAGSNGQNGANGGRPVNAAGVASSAQGARAGNSAIVKATGAGLVLVAGALVL